MIKLSAKIIILFWCCFFSFSLAHAQEEIEQDDNIEIIGEQVELIPKDQTLFTVGCPLTSFISPDSIVLEKFNTSNNLRRKPGSPFLARGKPVFVKARVLDRFCVPIPGALIKIWQADSSGKYEANYQKISPWEPDDPDYDENFAYSGTASTDNNGEFTFYTIFPGVVGDYAPHINLQIIHPDFPELTTMMFFNKHPANETDPVLLQLTEEEKKTVIAKGAPLKDYTDGRGYMFSITLDGISLYRGY